MIKILELNSENYKDYLNQIYNLGKSIKGFNNNNNKTGQFFGTSEASIIRYAKSSDAIVFVALEVDNDSLEQAKVVGYHFVNRNVPQNTNSDYTKYFHTGIDYKNNLANSFSDIKEYNAFVTRAYLEKILIFAAVASEITEDSKKNANGYDIATFIQKQVEADTFYENNFLRREINKGMYCRYEELGKVSDFAQIFFYSITDVDKELLKELYAKMNRLESLDALIANYELFLKYQEPKFIKKEQFDLEKYYDVEMKNSLELNTCAVESEYRSKGLPKILLYESLKTEFNSYFQDENNREIYLVSTVHNENTNSQNVLGAFGVKDYLYVERMKGLNRRVYISKVSREEYLEFIYEMELELILNYGYYSENFGIDIQDMKDRINRKIEKYQRKLELSQNDNERAYYEGKMAIFNGLLNHEWFQDQAKRS